MGTRFEDLEKSVAESRFTRRQVLQGALAVGAGAALAPALAACGGGAGTSAAESSADSSGGQPKQGGSLRVGIVGGSAKDSLNPLVASTEPQMCYALQLFDSLTRWDEEYQLHNHLAEEISANADASVWTVHLKPDLTWHDGKPVTADDVVFTYQTITDPSNPMPGSAMLGGLRPKGVVRIDERTVEFRLDAPNSILPEGFAYLDNMVVQADYSPNAGVGCGPFKIVDFKPGEQAVFAPFEGYWGEGPFVDELVVLNFADETARVNAFSSDVIDAMSQLPPAQVATVESGEGHVILRAKTGSWRPFTMRIDQKPFSDVRVRQALRLVVDRQQLIDHAYSGHGWIGNDMYAPFDPGTPDLPQREQDLEKAKFLLREAGYSDLAVELVTSEAVGSGAVEAAQVFAEQAKSCGVKVTVNKVDPSVFYGEDYLSWPFAQDFWYTRNFLAQAGACTLPTAPYNETHWTHEKWQALVEEAFRTIDETKRNELIAEAQTIEHEEGGYIIWAFNDQVDAYNQKIGGVAADKQGTPLAGFRFNKWYMK